MRFSNTLNAELRPDGMQVHCGSCEHSLGDAGKNWKHGATLHERPAHELDGPYRTGRNLLLRQFSCPRCGALLDTEMALSGDPWIEDRLFSPGG
jgi:acetone carboxylase gamma subunit